MEYNDFQILENSNYEKIASIYNSNQNNVDRKAYINKLYFEIEQCKDACLSLNKKVNPLLRNELKNTKQNLEHLLENFKSTFSNINKNNKVVNEFSIFSFIKKLFNICSILSNLILNEEKVYYKTFLNNTLNSIFVNLNNIISALEKSNIILFKHM